MREVRLNKLKGRGALLVAAIVMAMLSCGAPTVRGQAATVKKIVAVLDFGNAAVQGGVSGSTGQTDAPDIGKAVSQLLVAQLVKDGSVTVVERAALEKVIAEQNLSNSDRADPRTAAKIGKLLGADAIVVGTITRYDYDEQTKGYVGQKRGAPGIGVAASEIRHYGESAGEFTGGESGDGGSAGGLRRGWGDNA